MYHRTFAGNNPKSRIRPRDLWVEALWVLGLLLVAGVLFGINLGDLPLRDWDEATVAGVAREIWQTSGNSLKWLYPTLGGEAYHNKPPLMHLLIAAAYSVGGVSELTTRLPSAILTAVSVPLVYGIGREIFVSRTTAIFSALIYLTLLPVVRGGRLAMLDGAVLCFSVFMMWCVLRSRRDMRWALGAGMGFGLICLTKGMMGLLLGAIALLFLSWDTPRLLTSWYVWLGLLLGSAPVAAWYAAQFLHYGQKFINTGLLDQSLHRIWTPVENHKGPPWYYLLEIVKYAWPWLLFLPQGFRLAWENRNLGWAKLVLVWSSVYLVVVSLMVTKLPWYVLPVYPALALVAGAQLGEVWHWPSSRSYPRIWSRFLGLLGLIGFGGSLYFGGLGPTVNWHLQLMLASAALTLIVAAVLVAQKDLQFILILLWGTYISLLLLMTSPHWVWELAEAYPVKDVAAMVKNHTPEGQKVYTSFDYGRPSLNFYSDRLVIAETPEQLEQRWLQDSHPYLLLDQDAIADLSLARVKQLATVTTKTPKTTTWTLITRELSPK